MASQPPDPQAALTGSLALRFGTQLLGGADRIALLEAIHATGSVTQAAKVVGLSYKTAWDRVQDMNNVATHTLVERTTGGVGGGGARLTAQALSLIAAFRHIEQTHTQVLARLSSTLADPKDVFQTVAALGLRTSARNQWVGTVARVGRGEVNAWVELRLPGTPGASPGDTLHAAVTLASLKALGIRRGQPAVAVVKASSVFLALPGAEQGLSVRNRLHGLVSAIHPGAVNTEVQVRLRGGQTVVAMVDLDGARRLGLAEGSPVVALFPDTGVILGMV